MPDDSIHDQDAIIRTIQEVTGKSRSQLRDRLDEFAKGIQAAQVARKAEVSPIPEAPRVSVTQQAFNGNRAFHDIPPRRAISVVGTGGSAGLRPLEPYDASSGSTPKISVTPGTFGENAAATAGDGTPTIGGTPISDATPPTLTVAGTDTVIYLDATVNSDGQITSVTVEKGTSVPANTNTHVYVTLATIVVTTGDTASVACSRNLSGSQAYELCAGTEHIYVLI